MQEHMNICVYKCVVSVGLHSLDGLACASVFSSFWSLCFSLVSPSTPDSQLVLSSMSIFICSVGGLITEAWAPSMPASPYPVGPLRSPSGLSLATSSYLSCFHTHHTYTGTPISVSQACWPDLPSVQPLSSVLGVSSGVKAQWDPSCQLAEKTPVPQAAGNMWSVGTGFLPTPSYSDVFVSHPGQDALV